MKLFVELPTWMGDAVMATPALERIVTAYPDVKITFFGSYVATQLFLAHPHVESVIVDESRKGKNRYFWLYRFAKEAGRFDAALSFRSSFASRFLFWFLKAGRKCVYRKAKGIVEHQVVRYSRFVERCFGWEAAEPGTLALYLAEENAEKPDRKQAGINPGASYGSAKRWYPEKFAEVAAALSKEYDIVIFGGPGEADIAADIEAGLKRESVHNYENLAGKTSIPELMKKIASLDLFITGDSGPMHVAAAFGVPTVALFGPTKDAETSQWKNDKGVIVKKEMACAPCMKRTCPLGHHECMTRIDANDVLEAVKGIRG